MIRVLKVLGYGLLLILLAIAALSVFFNIVRTPSHVRNWKIEYQELPTATWNADGTTVTIDKVRDFDYGPGGSVQEVRYRKETYRPEDIDSLWYGISHFGPLGLAHSFLSFGFKDGRYLTISFEARQEVGQSYNPLLGLFGAYEMILVVSEERDVIGLRSHVRGERVFLYRILGTPQRRIAVFGEFMARLNEIYDSAEFYHTLVDNCLTSILKHAKQIPAWQRYVDYRILLPGYSDRMIYDRGFVDTSQPFAELQAAAFVDPTRTTLDDPAFSRKIRRH